MVAMSRIAGYLILGIVVSLNLILVVGDLMILDLVCNGEIDIATDFCDSNQKLMPLWDQFINLNQLTARVSLAFVTPVFQNNSCLRRISFSGEYTRAFSVEGVANGGPNWCSASNQLYMSHRNLAY